MRSSKHIDIATIFSLLVIVSAQPTCKTVGRNDVICTAGDEDYVLQRGLVSDNNHTQRITLRSCRIIEVDFEAFENDYHLKYIDLSGNRIQSFKLGVLDGNVQVTHLNLSHNMLTSFPLGLFDEKINLEVLDLKGNKINFLELGLFDPLIKLAHVDLSSNALLGKDISPYLFDKNNKITFIDYSRNDMSESPENLLHAFLAIDFLNLDRCSLKEVPSFALRPNLKTMKHLMLSTNQISKIDQTGTFVNLDNLEILNLAENIIDEITADVFKSLKKLKIVILRNNRLKTIPDSLFSNLIAISKVDLSFNFVEYVPVNAFRGTALKNLNLSHNRFSYLEANFCLELNNSGVKLKKFYINDNPWQCACLNEILNEMKTYNINYNSAKYDGNNAVCVILKTFTCKRQPSDNLIYIEMYDNNKGK